ncbi:hypothetical protein FACS189491_08930 [Spirochaetia bacterium]|nr:hypothetical protein FACS189491_08930 [Spirochaetia bacterium]
MAHVKAVRWTIEATGGLRNILRSVEKISDLDPSAALQIAEALRREKYSANYLNGILIAGFTAIKWAAAEKVIPIDPTEGLLRFSGSIKKRGVERVRIAIT